MAADNTVQISLEVVKKGFENIQELNRQLGEVKAQTEQYRERIKTLEQQHEKHTDALLKARAAIRLFHREMYLFTFTAATVTALLVGMAKNSENLAGQLEQATQAFGSLFNALGNITAKSSFVTWMAAQVQGLANFTNKLNSMIPGGKQAPVSNETFSFIQGLNAKTAGLQGNTRLSQELQLDVEFLQKIQPLLEKTKGSIAQGQLAQAWRDYRIEAENALRRSELGLKNNLEIMKDFKKQIVDTFGQLASDPIFAFLQGEHPTAGSILKGFQTNVNRALADAIGQAFKSSLFGGDFSIGGLFKNFKDAFAGKNHTTDAVNNVNKSVQTTNQILAAAKDCICRTAENTAAMAARGNPSLSFEGTITPPRKTTLDKIGAIAGAVSTIGGLFGGKPAGGGGGMGGGLPPGAGISMGGGAGDMGGGLPPGAGISMGGGAGDMRFASGGEVPIMATPGEFVIRRDVAQANKEFLKEMNITGSRSRKAGGGPVYLIKTNDAQSFSNLLATASGRAQIQMGIMRGIAENGNVRRVIQDFAR